MSQDKITILAMRNTDDAERIGLYKKQIAELAACINEREARVERRTKVIDQLNYRLQADFNLKLSRASDDASLTPLAVGDRYREGADSFVVIGLKDGVIGVTHTDSGRVVVSGKDLITISKVFFFDHPAAQLAN